MAKHKSNPHAHGTYSDLCKVFESSRSSFKTSARHERNQMLDAVYSPEVAAKLKEKFEMDDEAFSSSFNKLCARYDYTLTKMKLREKGTLTYMSRALSTMADIMPRSEIPATFFHMNSLIMNGGYDDHDQMHVLTTAAAIWILDHLQLQDKLDDLYELLLSIDIPGSFLDLPYLLHPTYPSQLIEQTALLLIHRNDGLYKEDVIGTSLADEWTLTPVLQRPVYTDRPLRIAFESLLTLLDQEAVSAATKRYEQKVWDFYRLAFAAEAYCNKEKKRHVQDIKRIEKEIDTLYAKPQKAMVAYTNPLLAKAPEIPLFGYTMGPAFQQALSPLMQDKRKHQEVIDHIDYAQSSLFTSLSLNNDREKYARLLSDVLPADLTNQLIHFSVDDPYETAFALLWLLDTGSLIPWAYYGSLSVATTAKDQLPFNARLCRPDLKPSPFALSPTDAYQNRYPYNQRQDMLDSDLEKVSRDFGMNLSQVIYRCTNIILPRLTSKTDTQPLAELMHLETDTEQMLATTLIDTLNARWLAPMSLQDYYLNSIKEEESTADTSTPEEDTRVISTEDYTKLKNELKKSKRNYYDATLKNRKLQQKLEASSAEMELMRAELHDLRTIVFQQQNSIEEAPVDPHVAFPQLVSKQVVSFGGHVSWLNRIRTMLPNVRFISPDTQPNEELLRNANEVWIQHNCLSHADFYKIINVVRSQHIPVRYFSYSSAEKCAEQLISSMKL